MGERALVILKKGAEFSPGLYSHWGGMHIADYIERLREIATPAPQIPGCAQMFPSFSVEDTFARLVVIAHLDRGASVVNLPPDFKGTAEELTGLSPDDSGTHLVDLDNGFSITSYGGYGAAGTPGREGGAADRFVSGIIQPLAENTASHTLTFRRKDGRILLQADGGTVSMSLQEAQRAAAELTRLTTGPAGFAHSVIETAKQTPHMVRPIGDAVLNAFAAAAKLPHRLTRVWHRLRHPGPGEP